MSQTPQSADDHFDRVAGVQDAVPWALLLLALLNIAWALWVSSAPEMAVTPQKAGELGLLHELSPADFEALQRTAGAKDAEVIVPTCDLYGPIGGNTVPVHVRRRVAVSVAGVGLTPEWNLNRQGYWVVAGPYETPAQRAAAQLELSNRGLTAFEPAQRFWQNLLVVGSAGDLDAAKQLRDRLAGEFGGFNVVAAGEMNLFWWLRIMHWEGADPGMEINAATAYSDGSELLKKSCKSIAKPIEFD